MDLISLCPFPIAAFPWQPRAGEWNLTVCVKATFSLVHGQDAQIAAVQLAVGDDAYWDGNPGASLYAPGDFVPYKPRVDVLLAGHAYAPGGAPVESIAVRLHVGPLVKELTVTGDRAWSQGRGGVHPGPPAPFRRMALRYERAALAGENSIGVDEAAHSVEVGRALSNIAAQGGHTPGFGPVPMLWRARRRNLPDAAVLWAYRVRLGSGAMPPGFEFNLFNAAPIEQQVNVLPPRAPIVLENLSPHLPRLESRLPALAPKLFRIHRETGRSSSVALRADTLWIDADRSLVVVSWRGLTPVPGPSDAEIGQLIVAVESDGERVRAEDIERLALTAASHRGPPKLAVVTSSEAVTTAAPQSAPRVEPPPSASAIADPPTITNLDVTQAVRVDAPLRVALPFRVESAKASEAPAAFDDEATQQFNMKSLNVSAILSTRAAPREPASLSRSTMLQAPERTPVVPPPPPLGASLFSATAAADALAEPAEPPPMLGAPLFGASVPASPESSSAAVSVVEGRRSLPAIEPEGVSVDRCAAIAAEIAEKRSPRDEILQARGITLEAWTTIEEHWAKAIAAEAKRSASKLTDAYDAAYVAAVESFRGPVTAEEYGRLLQAMKAGKVNQALDDLQIQRAAMPRLMRVWTKRLAEDPQLLRKVQSASGK